MNRKNFSIAAVVAALASLPIVAAAECDDDQGGLVKTGYTRVADHDEGRHRDNDRGDDNNRNNDNSNRQSDDDSTRGQARAEERRGEKDRKDKDKADHPWYDPLGLFARAKDHPWYDPLGLFD